MYKDQASLQVQSLVSEEEPPNMDETRASEGDVFNRAEHLLKHLTLKVSWMLHFPWQGQQRKMLQISHLLCVKVPHGRI